MGQQPTKHLPMNFSPPSNSSSRSEERATQGGAHPPGLIEITAPIFPPDGCQDTSSNGGKDLQQAFESFSEPPVTIQNDVNMPLVAPLTPLPLQCRICNASPTVGSRPTATVCGHLFCYEYVDPRECNRWTHESTLDASYDTSCRLPNVLCATIPSCCTVYSNSISQHYLRNPASVNIYIYMTM